MPKPKNIYVINPGGSAVVFVPHPTETGRWLRTDRSVVLVACTLCSAQVNEPCHDCRGGGWRGQTHWPRRKDAQKLKLNLTHNQVLVITEE